MASGAYQSPAVTGTGNSSNTSLENPVLSWGHAQHHDKFPYIRCFHWAQTTCLRFAPVCTKLGRSASAGAKVRRVTHSHHPKATRLTMEKSHLSWCLLPCSLYHCITTAPKGVSVPVCGFYQELKENVVNILQPCWHTVHGPYYFP